jgi:Putative mono-oxygenase ydhR
MLNSHPPSTKYFLHISNYSLQNWFVLNKSFFYVLKFKTKNMDQKKNRAKKVFTTKFNYSMPTEELNKIMPVVAPKFSEIPGCCWKIWLINEDQKEAGGVYLFESAAKLEQYLDSNLFASVANNPAFSNLQTNTFGISESASEITGAPLMNMNA